MSVKCTGGFSKVLTRRFYIEKDSVWSERRKNCVQELLTQNRDVYRIYFDIYFYIDSACHIFFGVSDFSEYMYSRITSWKETKIH